MDRPVRFELSLTVQQQTFLMIQSLVNSTILEPTTCSGCKSSRIVVGLSGMDRRAFSKVLTFAPLTLTSVGYATATNDKIFATIDGTDLRVGTDCSSYWIGTNQNGCLLYTSPSPRDS